MENVEVFIQKYVSTSTFQTLFSKEIRKDKWEKKETIPRSVSITLTMKTPLIITKRVF